MYLALLRMGKQSWSVLRYADIGFRPEEVSQRSRELSQTRGIPKGLVNDSSAAPHMLLYCADSPAEGKRISSVFGLCGTLCEAQCNILAIAMRKILVSVFCDRRFGRV